MVNYVKTRDVYEVIVGNNIYSYSGKKYGKYVKNIAYLSESLNKRVNNYYEIDNGVVSMYIYSSVLGYFTVIYDIDLLNEVMGYAWYIRKNANNYYCEARNSNENSRIKLHNLVLPHQDGFVVDHIDRNGLNNNKSNLRVVSTSDNGRNSRKYSSNKSGYKGVYFLKSGLIEARWSDINRKHVCIRYNPDDIGYDKALCSAIIARYEGSKNNGYLHTSDESLIYNSAKLSMVI